jgi:hypothetical protein
MRSRARNGRPTRVIDAWSALTAAPYASTHRRDVQRRPLGGGYGAKVVLRYGSRTYEGCAARF